MSYLFGVSHGLPNVDVFGPDDMDTTSDRDIDLSDYDIDVGLGLTAPAQRQDDDVSIQDAREGELDEQDSDQIMTDEDDIINYGDEDEATAQTASTGNYTFTSQTQTAATSYAFTPQPQTAPSSSTVMPQAKTAFSSSTVIPQVQTAASGTIVTAQAQLASSGNASSVSTVTPPAPQTVQTPVFEDDLIDYSSEEEKAPAAPHNQSNVSLHQAGTPTVNNGAQTRVESTLDPQPTDGAAAGSAQAASSEHTEDNNGPAQEQYYKENDDAAHDQYEQEHDDAAQEQYVQENGGHAHELYDEEHGDIAQEPYDEERGDVAQESYHQQDEDDNVDGDHSHDDAVVTFSGDDAAVEQAEAGSRFCRTRPVTVNYDGDELWLFKEHDADGSGDYLLEDSSLVHSSISEFFQACRSALGGEITSQMELGLRFEHVHDIELYEDNTACVAVSLERILTLYYTLHAQDGLIEPESFYMRMLTRPRFAALLSDLASLADQSRGFSGLEAAIAAGETHFVDAQSRNSTEPEGTDRDNDEDNWALPAVSSNDAEHQPEVESVREEDHGQETFENKDADGDGETEHQPSAEEDDEQQTFESNDGNADGEIEHQAEAEVAGEEVYEQETFEINDDGDDETEHQHDAEVAPKEGHEQGHLESNDGNGHDETEQSAQDRHDADESVQAHTDNNQQALHTTDSVGSAAPVSSHQADAAAPEMSHEQAEEYDLIDYSDDDIEEAAVKQTILPTDSSASSSTVQGDEPAIRELRARSVGSQTAFQDGASTNQVGSTEDVFNVNAEESEYQDYTNEEFTAYEYQGLDQQESIDFTGDDDYNGNGTADSSAVVDEYTGDDEFLDLDNPEWGEDQDLTAVNDDEDVILDIDFDDGDNGEEDGAVAQPTVAASSAAAPVATSSNGILDQSPQGQKRSIDEVGDAVDDAPDSTDTKRLRV